MPPFFPARNRLLPTDNQDAVSSNLLWLNNGRIVLDHHGVLRDSNEFLATNKPFLPNSIRLRLGRKEMRRNSIWLQLSSNLLLPNTRYLKQGRSELLRLVGHAARVPGKEKTRWTEKNGRCT